jgi:DNA-binding phage protein
MPSFLPVAVSGALALPRPMPRPKKINTTQVHNRILALMAHTKRYAFKGETRLAADAGVSKSAICRLLNGHSSPSYALVAAVTRALEKHLGHALDPRDLISTDGTYPTPSACQLAGCKGCLPAEVYDENNQVKSEYQHLRPGQWTVASPAIVRQHSTSSEGLQIVGRGKNA